MELEFGFVNIWKGWIEIDLLGVWRNEMGKGKEIGILANVLSYLESARCRDTLHTILNLIEYYELLCSHGPWNRPFTWHSLLMTSVHFFKCCLSRLKRSLSYEEAREVSSAGEIVSLAL